MSHEIETTAYAHAVPWHGLGINTPADAPTEVWLKNSGLDWTVRSLPMYAYDPDSGLVLPTDRKAITRSTDNKVLTVTGPEWKPLQNEAAFDFFRSYTEAGGATMETAGSLRGGKVVWCLASLNEKFSLSGDVVKGYLLLVSPHQVGSAITVLLTTVRVVCANTMAMAMNGKNSGKYTQNHLTDFDADLAKHAIGIYRSQFDQARIDAEALASMKMSEFETVRFLSTFFQPADKATVADKTAYKKFVTLLMDDPEAQNKKLSGVLTSVKTAPGAEPGNAWGVLNGVTHYFDHVAGYKADARMFNSWLGDAGKTKLQVNKKLLELASK